MVKSKDSLPSLDGLQRKIDEAKSHAGTKQGENPDSGADGIGTAMKVGVELVSGVAVGSIAGYFLDRWLGTMPWFFIICFFLGAAAGFKNLLRNVGNMNDESNT